MSRIIVFLFCVLAAASATRSIVPVGKEVVYDYMTEVLAGTHEPMQFGSRFYLKCKLHIQGLKEDTLGFKMTDCMFRINNGKFIVKDLKDALFLPFPTEATELMLPFHVQYDSTGKVLSFFTDKMDKEWSMNIKRAVMNIFQFDMDVFKAKTDEFMIFPEETLFGRCDMRYLLSMKGTDKFELVKVFNPIHCSRKDAFVFNYFEKKMTDQKMLTLKKNYQPYAIGNNRMYKIMFVDGFYRIDKVIANGDIVFAPYKARSDVEQVKSIQTFEFIHMIDMTEKFMVNDHIMFKGLEYISPMKKCQESAMNVVDFTGGRHMMKYDLLMTKVYTKLDEIIDYIDTNQITMENMKTKHSHVMNRLLKNLKLFDVATFEQVFTHLYEKKSTPIDERKYKIFLQMLPNVGTRMSVVFIRNLIRKQKIDEDMAAFMLQNFPMHVECPNEKLLMEVEDLLTIVTDVKSRLYRACILSFSTLFGRTFHDMTMKSELIDKYIMMMLTKFKEASEYQMKILYIRAMGNMRHISVLKYLAPFMFGEEKVSKDIRIQMYWAMYPLLTKDYILCLKYTTPLFTDLKADTELRIVGYTILMMCNIDLHHFLNMYWWMAYETNEVFYTFHYNTMVAMSKCEFKERADMARLILRISRKPIQLTYGHGIYFHMLNNEYFGYGGWTEQLMYNTHDTMAFYGSLTTFVHQKAFNLFGMHMRIRGMEGKMRNEMIKELMNWKTFFAPNDFFKKFGTEMNEHFCIEIMFFHRQRCIMTYYFDKTNIHDIMKVFFDMKFFEHDMNDNMQKLYYPLMVEKVMPIDCGLPFMFFEYVPMVKSFKFNFHKEMKDDFLNMHMNMRFKMLVNGYRGMKFYNPINDVWHGIMKAQSFAFVLPLNFDFIFNYKTFDNFRLIFNKVQSDDVFGFQNYFESQVFIQGLENHDLLTKFNDKAVPREMITMGDMYKKSMNVLEKEDHFFGRKVEIGFFNCERPLTIGAFMNKMQFWFENRFKHMDRLFFTDYWLTLLNFHTFILTYPEMGNCGYAFRWMPSMEKPIERLEFVFNFHKEKLSDPMIFLQERNWDMKMTMMHKGAGDKIIRNYDMNMLMHLGKHHMDNKFHFKLLRTEAGLPDFKFDFDYKQVFTMEGMDGILKLMYGSVDNLGIIDIHGKGMWSEEQKMMLTDKSFTYTQCLREISNFHSYYPRDFHCMLRASMFHHYTMDIKFNDRYNYYIREILGMREQFFYKMMPYMHKTIKKEITDKNTWHIDILFPVLRREVDITVDTPLTIRKYMGVPMDYYLHQYHNFLYYYNTRNMFYSYYFMHLLHHGLIKHCVVDYNTILTDSNSLVKYMAPNDWILYAGDVMENPKFGVWIKKVEGVHPLALKIKIEEDILEIIPHGDKCMMMLNGKEIPFTNGFHMESFFNYFYVPNPKMVMLMTHKFGLHIEFDGYSVRMHYPYGTMMPTVGKCMASK